MALCTICGLLIEDLHQHLLDQHGVEDGRLPHFLYCDECESHFTSHFQLNRHKRVHHCRRAPYTWKYCGKDFSQALDFSQHGCFSSGLRTKLHSTTGHESIETNGLSDSDSAFKCISCGIRFSTGPKLLEHNTMLHTSRTLNQGTKHTC